MIKDFIHSHLKGESVFIDDMNLPKNTLILAVIASPVAAGVLKNIDTKEALASDGVIGILLADDIPGENELGNIIQDEKLFVENELEFIGQPIGIIAAENAQSAKKALKKIKLDFEEHTGIFDPRDAYKKNLLIAPPRTFQMGNMKSAWEKCDVIIEDRVDSGMQEHLYLETQNAVTILGDNGKLFIYSSTQSPTAVQRTVASVMGLPMHQIEVDVLRLGGAFGGKEDQATAWAAMTALAAQKFNRPAKLVLGRHEDLTYTGKRHAYSSDYKLGLSKDGKILAYEVMFYQNGGASADLSTAILERTLFHSTNSYYIPNVSATAASCKTNLVPNTAYRGFGGPQAMFVLESAIHRAAEVMNFEVLDIQRKNLIKKDDTFPYGMKVLDNHGLHCFDRALSHYNYDKKKQKIDDYNRTHTLKKKGLSLMPICFGISFTSTFLNQASALVHVYTDGSVGISTGAVEMGQGVNRKMKLVASKVFSLSIDKIKIESTNTTRAANTSPTAASSAADMNGNAVKIACDMILERLKDFISEKTQQKVDTLEIKNNHIFINGEKSHWSWKSLVWDVYFSRTSLSAQAHYATPNIFFDKKTEKGDAFAYHVVGTAITEVTLDTLRGQYHIDSVEIVHDFGESLDPLTDRGQVEGALVQGIGWVTIEDIQHNSVGRNLADTLATYKIPDIYFAPDKIDVDFYENPENSKGPFNSKAIGEPPFMYGIGAYFAIENAMKAFRPGLDIPASAPLTPEKVLMTLYQEKLLYKKYGH